MFDWQNVVALTVVAVAAAYVARHGWRALASRPSRPGCGGCSSCPSKTAGGREFVSLTVGQQAGKTAGRTTST
jgi:hypothetical protein